MLKFCCVNFQTSLDIYLFVAKNIYLIATLTFVWGVKPLAIIVQQENFFLQLKFRKAN